MSTNRTVWLGMDGKHVGCSEEVGISQRSLDMSRGVMDPLFMTKSDEMCSEDKKGSSSHSSVLNKQSTQSKMSGRPK